MLRVERLEVSIGPIPILRGVDLEAPGGSMCGLIGRNGAGKTTFMRSVMGLLPAHAGSILFDDSELRGVAAHMRAHLGIGYMPEDRRLVPEFTAEENILLPVWSTDIPDSGSRLDRIYALIPEVAGFRHRRSTQLSGGQQKLVALARAIMCGRRLLLLDEPFEGVAPALAQRLAEILSDLKGEGVPTLLAESNDAHIADLLDRIYVIERGSIAPH